MQSNIIKIGADSCVSGVLGFCPSTLSSGKPTYDTLRGWFDIGLAKNLVLEKYNSCFWIEYSLNGLNTESESVWRLRRTEFIQAETLEDAIDFIKKIGLLPFYEARYDGNGYLFW